MREAPTSRVGRSSQPLMRSDSQRRAVLVGACLLALLVVVALATRSPRGGSEGGPGPGGGFVDYVFTVFLVVFVLLIPFAIWFYWLQRESIVFHAAQGRKKQRRYANLVTGLVLVAIALWIQYLRTHRSGFIGHFLRPPQANPPKGSRTGTAGTEPVFQWWLAALIVGVVLAGVVTVIVLVRRSKLKALREAQTAAEAVSLALDEALDDLRDGDPREAVIRAYARLEKVLAFYGLARAPHEAPFEWLSRILVELHASAAAVERLTALFERAKFSRHEIDEEMREEAISALTAVRDELRPAPAEPDAGMSPAGMKAPPAERGRSLRSSASSPCSSSWCSSSTSRSRPSWSSTCCC